MCPEQLGAFAQFIQALCALAMVAIAWAGLSTWKRSLAGTAEQRASEKVLRPVFRLRNRINTGRDPAKHSWESTGRPISPEESSAERALLDERYGNRRRLEPVYEALVQLQSAKEIGTAYWGAECEKLLGALEKLGNRFMNAHLHYFASALQDVHSGGNPKEKFAAMYDVLYSEKTPDNFGNELEAAVQSIVKFLREKLYARTSKKKS